MPKRSDERCSMNAMSRRFTYNEVEVLVLECVGRN